MLIESGAGVPFAAKTHAAETWKLALRGARAPAQATSETAIAARST